MTTNDQYALNWSNHTTHVKKAFDSLLAANEFVDVTLACEGKKVGAHRMLLSACSTYFHDLFRDNPCQHPIVLLKDVKYQHLVDILKFIYNGEVSVAIDTFDTFLKTAEFLQISGLTDDEGHFATTDRDTEVTAVENSIVGFEQSEDDLEPKPVKKFEHIERPTTRKSDKPKDVKRKAVEKLVEATPITHKKRKENAIVKEAVPLKKEIPEVIDDDVEEPIEDPLEIPNENHEHADTESESYVDMNDSELLQPTATSRKYHEVQDLLAAKVPKGTTSKFHKLEERIGKLEASRSFCKGCYVKTRLGHITNDKIKKVNTFCPGCDGLPNYCKPCFRMYHKGTKNTIR